MSVQDILQKSQITNTNKSPTQFALPDIPKPIQTYNPRTSVPNANYNNAEDQLVEVLGFLPINPKYMSNTTNGLAYNSMADVLFNRAAHAKRWGEDSWLNTPIGYIPRVVADTALLLKDTIANPIVGSVQMALKDPNDDIGLFKGITAGLSTAVLNSLVNAGNSLDILSNPLKGFILDGPDGFVKGLVGDSNGRKQYDYNNYINTGDGVVDFILSLGAEIFSDPMTYVSFGITSAAKSGSKKAVQTAVDIASETVDNLTKRGAKTIISEAIENNADDALEQAVKHSIKYVLDNGTDATTVVKDVAKKYGYNVPDDKAKSFLKEIVTQEGVDTKSVSKMLDNAQTQLPTQLQKIITSKDIPLDELPSRLSSKNILQRLAFQSDTGTALTPAQQNYFASLFDVDKLPSAVTLSKNLQHFEKGFGDAMRYGLWASSGMLPFSLTKKGITKLIKKGAAKRNLIKMAETAANTTQFLDSTDKAINFDGEVFTLNIPKQEVKALHAGDTIIEETIEETTEDSIKLLDAPEVVKGLPEKATSVTTSTNLIPVNVDANLHEAINAQIDDAVASFRNALYNGKTYITPSEFKALREDCVNRINQIFLKNNFEQSIPFTSLKTYIDYLQLLNKYGAPKYIAELNDKLSIINKWLLQDVDESLMSDVSRSVYNRAMKVLHKVSNQEANLNAAEEARTAIAHILKYNNMERDVAKEWANFGNVSELANIGFKLETDFDAELFYDLGFKQSNVYAEHKVYANAGSTSLDASDYDLDGAGIFVNKIIDQEYMTFLNSKGLLDTKRQKFIKTLKELDYYDVWKKSEHSPIKTEFIQKVTAKEDQQKILDVWYEYVEQAKATATSYYTLYDALVTDAKHLAPDAFIRNAANDTKVAYQLAVEQLPHWERSVPYANTVDVNNIIKYGLVGYGFMLSKRGMLTDLLKNYGHTDWATGYAKILTEYALPESPLYKLLHSPQYKNNIHVQSCIKCFDNVIAYTNLTKQITPIIDTITEYHQQGIMDALVTQLSKYNAFDEVHMDETITKILDAADLSVQTKFNTPKLSMDVTLWNLAKQFEKSTDSTKAHYAKLLIESLPKAHSAEADVLNLSHMLQLMPDLRRRIVEQSKGAPILVADIETTGLKNSEIYQLSVRLLDDHGNDTGIYNTYHIAVSKTPDKTTLEKLTQAYTLLPNETPEQWFKRTYILGQNSEIQTYPSMFEALQDFQNKYLNKHKPNSLVVEPVKPFFVGHNFKRFDLPQIVKNTRYNPKLKQFFKEANVFDTYEYMLDQHVWQLDELTRENISSQLRRLFETSEFLQDGNPQHTLITYAHLQDLSEIKKMLSGTDDYVVETGKHTVKNQVYDYNGVSDTFMDVDGTPVTLNELNTIGYNYGIEANELSGVELTDELFDNAIRDMLDVYKKYTGSGKLSDIYTTSKTIFNPDEYAKLMAEGVVNIPRMQNIMSMLNAYITNEDMILLNPYTAYSHEFTNYFDAQKIINDYAASGVAAGHAPISVLQKVTKKARTLTEIRNGLTSEAVRKAIVPATELLETLTKYDTGVFKYLNDVSKMSDEDLVALAIYYKQQVIDVSSNQALKQQYSLLDFKELYKDTADDTSKIFDKDYQSFSKLKESSANDRDVRYKALQDRWATEKQERRRITIKRRQAREKYFEALHAERSEAWQIRDAQRRRLRQHKTNIIEGEKVSQLRRKVHSAQDAANKIWSGELGDVSDLVRLTAQAENDPLVAFKNLYEDKGLYSAVKRAKSTLYGETHKYTRAWYDLLKESTPEQQAELFKQLREIDNSLTELARGRILTRPDRVNAFKQEARLTGGRLLLATDKPVDLSDFAADEDLITMIIPVQLEQPIKYRNPDLEIKIESDGFNILKDGVQYNYYKNTPKTKTVFLNFIGVKATAYKDILTFKRPLSAAELKLYDDAGITYRMVKEVAADKQTTYKYYLNGAEELSNGIWNKATFIKNENHNAKLNEIHESVLKQFSKCVSNAGCSTGDVLTLDLMHALDKFIADGSTDQLVPTQVLQSNGFFNTLRANNMIIGDAQVQKLFNPYYADNIINRTATTVKLHVDKHIDDTTLLINFMCNKENGLATQEVFNVLSNQELRSLAKKHKTDWALVYVTECGKWDKTASGFVVHEITDLSDASLDAARKVNAHFVPRENMYELMKTVNTFELPGWTKHLQQLSLGYKLGYLGSVGTVVRNLIDSNYKNHIDDPNAFALPLQLKRFNKSYEMISKYNDVMIRYTNRCGNILTDVKEYRALWHLCNDNTDELAQLINKSTELSTSIKRIQTYFTPEDITYFKEHMLNTDMFELVHGFINNGPSAGLSQKVLNELIDTGADKSMLNWVTQKTPLKYLYSANEMVEQTARFSKYIEELEKGVSVSDAALSVIKTHFDYSDKSLMMLYTEMIFPFMSFSFRNLNYWLDTITKNSSVLFELENIFRTVLNYQSLFEPDYEAYAAYDYSFDFKDDVVGFGANAPWQMINAARLFHLLQGNVVVDTGKTVKHDNGYGEKDNELYAVFKLSPSVLDAVRMLYNPIDAYQQRLLPPYEVLSSTFLNVLNGKAPIEDISINGLLNNLPLIGAPIQRAGVGKSNNINKRIQDAGLPMAVSSLFTAAYQPIKKKYYWYDENGNRLNETPHTPYRKNAYYHRKGGFTPTYSIGRTYSSPYSSDKPEYHITKLARQTPYKDIYRKPATKTLKDTYLNFYKGYLDIDFMRKHLYEKYRYL